MSKELKDKKKNEVKVEENMEVATEKAMFSRDAIKQRGFGRFVKSFGYSIDGLKYAYKYEQSMFIHIIFTVLVVGMNFLLRVTGMEWLITLIAIGMVLAAELINTAVEATVDMVTLEINPLAKIAKDCTSAATFVLSMMAAAIGFIVYIPYILVILGL